MASLPRPAFHFIIISLTLLLLHSQTIPKTSFSQSVIFHFPPFCHDSLTLAGTSSIQNGALWLTRNTGNLPSTSFGAALFHYPIAITPLASFSTNFTFLIANPNLDSPEGNLKAFFLTRKSSIHDPPDAIKNESIFFLEFLAFKHLKTADSNLVTAWIGIEYREGAMKTRVLVGDPGINIREERQISISNHFVEHMIFAGFASSIKNSTESHAIESWNLSFSTHITDGPLHATSRIGILSNKAPNSAPNLRGNIIGVAVLAAAAAAALLFSCVNVKEQFHRRFGRRTASDRFIQFDYRDVVAGTGNFEDEIGEGATSQVYKMKLPGSSAFYAVKRFRDDENGRKWFQIEFEVVTHLRHENILELKGWSRANAGEYLLIYDYMSKDSLKSVLHGRNPPFFPWDQRYAIAMKLARALRYLHEDCSPFVLHGDVKSSNILLTEEFEPKLADFGLSLRGPPYKATGKSEHYSAPECEPDSLLDARADVYSYGVVALEICTGMMASGLVEHVRGLQLKGRIFEAADGRLGGSFDRDEMWKLLQVGLACTVEEKERRPSMALVLKVFQGKVTVGELRAGVKQKPREEEDEARSI